MRAVWRISFYILIGLLFIEILIIAPDYTELQFEQEQLQNQDTPGAGSQRIVGLHLVESQGGRRDWEMLADQAESNGGQGVWSLKKVHVVFFVDKKNKFVVFGDHGKIDTNSKNMEIVGNVRTTSTNGYEFRAPAIFYEAASRTLRSPESILMKGPKDKSGGQFVLSGRGMVAEVNSSLMYIESQVKAERVLASGKMMRIESGKAQFSGNSNMASFLEGVKIQYDLMSIRGPEANFEFEAHSDLPKGLFVNGGVSLQDKSRTANSETLKIDFSDEKYVFKGRPRVVQDGDELSGEEIIFLDGGKRVKIEKVRARVEERE